MFIVFQLKEEKLAVRNWCGIAVICSEKFIGLPSFRRRYNIFIKRPKEFLLEVSGLI